VGSFSSRFGKQRPKILPSCHSCSLPFFFRLHTRSRPHPDLPYDDGVSGGTLCALILAGSPSPRFGLHYWRCDFPVSIFTVLPFIPLKKCISFMKTCNTPHISDSDDENDVQVPNSPKHGRSTVKKNNVIRGKANKQANGAGYLEECSW